MKLGRFMSMSVALAALFGCESIGIPTSSDGIYADAQAQNRLESVIGEEKGDDPVTAAGTLLGDFLGKGVAETLRASDRRFAETTARESLTGAEIGTLARWTNPETGHSGTFKPTNTYRSVDDLLCRDYLQSVTADGQTDEIAGTACQSEPGIWRVALGIPVRRAFRPVRDPSSRNRRR